jgi:type IV pilus assembly protein PilX
MVSSRLGQTGAALVTGLIFLVVLTLISLSAIKSTSLGERMAGNARDQDIAFEAAEAGLRDGLRYIASSGLTPASPFAAGCAAGLCLNDAVYPVWETITSNNDWSSGKTKPYLGATLVQASQQPRYIIELMPSGVPPSGTTAVTGKGINSGAQTTSFRVTSRGWGLVSQTQMTVQSAINY